ncbi:MAG: hypothetical protein J5673_01860 [Candidatus Methanomethylophilaceae archaeon]|nr:hypothetical protein [Candidatus Methanomethylophilaceae archaeon]
MDRTDDILFSILTDHVKFNETVKYVSEMFEREVFDSAIILNSSRITLSIAGIASLKKDPLIFKDGSLMGKDVPSSKDMNGKRFIIVGDALSSGSVACEMIKTINDNGGTVVKLGFVVEDTQFNSRKKSLKGYPVESMIMI